MARPTARSRRVLRAAVVACVTATAVALIQPAYADRSAPADDRHSPSQKAAQQRAIAQATQTAEDLGYGLSLDFEGKTIPDTNFPIPSGAIYLSTTGNDANSGLSISAPVRTLNRAIDVVPSSGTIVVRGGEYRDWYNSGGTTHKIVTKPINLQAYPHEQPWFSGADVKPAAQWTKVRDGLWSTPWTTSSFCVGQYYDRWLFDQSSTGPCSHQDNTDNPSNVMAVDPQMAFVNGTALRQVMPTYPQADLAAGTFAYDRSARKMYIPVNPATAVIELSARPVGLILGGAGNNSVRGIGFRRYATNEFHNLTGSALYIGGATSVVDSSVFAENAGGGLAYSNPKSGSVVKGSAFVNNGYTALAANGTSMSNVDNNFTISGNIFNINNAEGFGERCTASCGQAAVKLAHMQKATLTRNMVTNTIGPRTSREGFGNGLWCDLMCRNINYTYNVLVNNPGVGIYHEVSDTGIIASNAVAYSQYGVGVASANTKVYNNTLLENVQGMRVYDDSRSPSTNGDVGPDTRAVSIVNNIVTGNNVSLKTDDAQIGSGTDVAQYFSMVKNNSYHQRNGTAPKFAFMQAPNSTGRYYATVSAFQVDWSGLEAQSHWITGDADPFFVDEAGADYTVRPGSVAAGSAASLPTDVAAALGVSTTALPNRGTDIPLHP